MPKEAEVSDDPDEREDEVGAVASPLHEEQIEDEGDDSPSDADVPVQELVPPRLVLPFADLSITALRLLAWTGFNIPSLRMRLRSELSQMDCKVVPPFTCSLLTLLSVPQMQERSFVLPNLQRSDREDRIQSLVGLAERLAPRWRTPTGRLDRVRSTSGRRQQQPGRVGTPVYSTRNGARRLHLGRLSDGYILGRMQDLWICY
jgi:hypothetical protein